MERVIRDPETEALLDELAEVTGLPAEEALKRVVGERLARQRDVARKVAETQAWLRSLGPVPPGPSQEEIIAEMYDENGLPR
ncbi:type II toxin-antitoxin system VapB family antitoxin [Sphingoaurantiacus capsulatus]|uniref:Type II toxin-antitoxin system VapB family antitoxin n=1 Tax=Sphingoaurantiacus capsulatus TaxID=1771310 RepID=A0ABV7X656_9SPHN